MVRSSLNTRLTRRMLLMRLMLQAAENSRAAPEKIAVDFDSSLQSLAALEAAAYRLIGIATCQIDRVADRFVCRLTLLPINSKRENIGLDDLRVRFMNFVTDENLRVRVAERTDGARNVILALAFGSLAATQSKPE